MRYTLFERLGLICFLFAICQFTHAGDVDFAKDVAPILRHKCIECHNGILQMAELRLDSRQAMIDGGVLDPGDADESLLVQRLHDKELGLLMPPSGRLDDEEISTLQKWVNRNATWPEHVSLVVDENHATQEEPAHAVFSVIRNDNMDAFQKLLRDKERIDVRNHRGSTPLMHAAFYARPEIVELLLQAGADVHAKDHHGMTPLMLAISNVAKVRLLLKHGANPNAQSNLGRTPLLLASAFAGNSQVVQALVDAGANVQYSDKRNLTAVLLAARTGDADLVGTLLDAGGNLHGGSKGVLPGTPLVQSAWASDVQMAKLLLERGAKTDQQSLNTSLIFAATHGSLEMAKLLLEAGADPHANIVTNYVPESPLLAAAYSDALNADIVRILLNKNVDTKKKDKRGESALSMARMRGPTEIVKMLQSHGELQNDKQEANRELSKHRVLDPADIKPFVQKSVALLQTCGPQFFANSGCVACHQQTATSLVVPLARTRGIEIDEKTEQQQIKLTSFELKRKRVGFLQRIKLGGASHRLGYLLWGLAMSDYPPDEITDATWYELYGLQLKNGSWVSDAHRPPTEYSPVTATAVSLRGLQQYAPPGFKPAAKKRVALATEWLVQKEAFANAEKSFRLLGLFWGAADAKEIAKAKRDLVSGQQKNGGWSQLPDLPSDAYATGLTLYALHQAGGVEVSDAAYRKGVEFLMQTKQQDGSWHVRSRSFSFQPYFESGFPHGHDQWISAAATGWATMALLQTIEPVSN